MISCVKLRGEDEVLVCNNELEFVKKDVEGGDMDIRRKVAFELVTIIPAIYKAQVTSLVFKNMVEKYVVFELVLSPISRGVNLNLMS